MNISTRVKKNSEPDPVVGASNEVNTEAGVYDEGPAQNGDGSLVLDMPLSEARRNAENPHWDGCIGESTARRLAKALHLAEQDTQRINALCGLSTFPVICRWSTRGRGWRLHETSQEGASVNLREAIDKFLAAEGIVIGRRA
jgi:hypothetical protein